MSKTLTTTSAHVALYGRLVSGRDTLVYSYSPDAKRRPDAAAPRQVCIELSWLIHGARRIGARMPGGSRLPFRPLKSASNAEALALLRQVGTTLHAFKECYEEWDDAAGDYDEDEDGLTGAFVWRTMDGY